MALRPVDEDSEERDSSWGTGRTHVCCRSVVIEQGIRTGYRDMYIPGNQDII